MMMQSNQQPLHHSFPMMEAGPKEHIILASKVLLCKSNEVVQPRNHKKGSILNSAKSPKPKGFSSQRKSVDAPRINGLERVKESR
jgi:hypothetical protein